MKDSRKGKRDGEKGLSTPDPHVDGGKGKKAIVYNTKGENQEGGLKKKARALEHVRGYFLYRYTRVTLSFEHYNPTSWP